MIRLVEAEGLTLDVCSGGELALAKAVGFPPERIVLHGNVKNAEDLKTALSARVGRIVLDSGDEIDQLSALVRHRQDVLIRVTPEVDAGAHKAVATGVADQKFGFGLSDGGAVDAKPPRIYQALIELTEAIGAAPHDRSAERTAQRNGHRARTLTTPAGDLELRIPKLRTGSFFPSLLERRRRVDQALFPVVMESYLHGVSTGKVDDLVRALGADTGISTSEVSRI
jgi:hypothetical protein